MAAIGVLQVLAPGLLTTVQDRGRIGFGRFGVAPSGALDSVAMRVGNLLVDNPEAEAVLELTLPGFKATILSDAVAALTGADLGLHINGKPFGPWRSYRLYPGDILSLETLNSGCRSYLALGGGLQVPVVLGSRSTNLSSEFGGLDGRPLRSGDILKADSPRHYLHAAGRKFDLNTIPSYRNYWELRVVMGPQDDHFIEEACEKFLTADYQVSPKSDRTGIRLQGPRATVREGHAESIISEGIIAGAVQVPGDGQPIIVLGETVSGGYRKIATVISADLHLLGQVLPGDRVRFQAVTPREARQALWRQEGMIGRFRDSLM
jgi:antagonist of KipI